MSRYGYYAGPTFDSNDIGLLIGLVAGLNPDKYVTDEARALIYRAKVVIESDSQAYRLDMR